MRTGQGAGVRAAGRHAAGVPDAGGAGRLERRAFRPEIQGLRAVAVMGVVVYHLWPASLTGGFVGVDVFFVISGFLITQQLADEAAATGRVRLGAFWARRIRRILPAAFTVLAACVAAVELVLPRVAARENLADIRAAAAYVENWQLAARAVDYLAAESNPSLVQHYWSLSVEEQFYLAWPLLLVLAVALARRLSAVGARAWLVAVLAAAGLASLVVSVAWTAADPATAFFATPTRAWEFAAGGTAAVLLPRARGGRHPRLRPAVSALGLALVLAGMTRITGDASFPGVIALLPVAGAVLVVAADLSTAPRTVPARLWTLPPVQWLGDLSYAIYLWHWPLVVAAPWLLHRTPTTSDRFAVLAASVLLAALTKVLVEDPVRRGHVWRSRVWLTYAIPVVGAAAVVVPAWAVSNQIRSSEARTSAAAREEATRQTQALVAPPMPAGKGPAGKGAGGQGPATPAARPRSCFGAAAMDPSNACPHPYARPADLDTAFAAADGSDDPCLQPNDATIPRPCTLGRTSRPTRTVAVVGNSHAWRLVPALTLYAQQHGWQVVVATRIDCLGHMTTAVGTDGASRSCLAWSAALDRQLLSMPHLDAVVYAGYRFTDKFTVGRDPTPAQVRARETQVLSLWSALAARGTRVVVTDDVPGLRPTSAPDCIAQSDATDDPCAVARSTVVGPDPIVDLARSHPRLASHVPLTQYFCDATTCHALIGGVIVYFDSHHLTTTYSRSLARYLGDAVAAAMARR